jgi:hypothetical protein
MIAWLIEGVHVQTRRAEHYAGEGWGWVADPDYAMHFTTEEEAIHIATTGYHPYHRHLVVVEHFFAEWPYGTY